MAVDAGADQTNLEAFQDVTVTATGGTGNHTWIELSGLDVDLPGGTSASRTFKAPAAVDGGSTILRVTDGAGTMDALTLTTLPHNEWAIRDVALTYPEQVLADSPLLYWRLGEASGTTAADTSGNGHTGTIAGSPLLSAPGLVDGDSNTAIRFDGANDFVVAAAAGWMDVTTALTLECLVKIPPTNDVRSIAGRYRSGNSTSRFRLLSSGGQIDAQFQANAGSSPTTISSGLSLDDDQPHHVALTWDGTTMRLYADGTQVGSAAFAGPMTATADHFFVGAEGLFTGTTSAQGFLDGTIDEVAFYGTCLSPTRVAAHATAAGV